jgi:hypothetical protein
MRAIQSSSGSRSRAEAFWRSVRLEEGQSAIGRLASFELHLHRRASEWWIAHRAGVSSGNDDVVPSEWRIGEEVPPPVIEQGATVARHLFHSCPAEVLVRPALADRHVIARPLARLSIAPRQRAVVYASTPIWVEVVAAGTTLASVPTRRPADTWFGPSPAAGELCYAVPTRARLDLDEAPPRPDAAVTEARIDNRTDEPLVLDFLRIPAPHLSLWAGDGGRLFTEPILLEQEEVGEAALLDIESRRPAEAAGAERLAAPRSAPPARGAFEAFQRKALATLFGD